MTTTPDHTEAHPTGARHTEQRAGGARAVDTGTDRLPQLMLAVVAVAAAAVLMQFTGGDTDEASPSEGAASPSEGAAVGVDPSPRADAEQDPPATPAGDYPGQPPAGTVYLGAVVGSNGDPGPRHEQPTDTTMGIRRTYFQWSDRTGDMVTTAEDDLAAGRLPWVSIKPPSWQAVADGQHDDEIDAMLTALDGLSGPVWLTVHHEPEGGGGVNAPDDPAGPDGHVAMNRRVRQRMTALGTTDVALVPIMMSWTWDPRSGRDPDQWWADGIYDALGIDHYVREEESLIDERWSTVRRWAAARDVDIAVGEWGLPGTDARAGARVREWYDMATTSSTDDGGAPVVALVAYDKQHHGGDTDWQMRGAQLEVFHELMRDPRTAQLAPG